MVFRKIAIIGPPGSGKGTYSKEISEKYGFVRIEPGKMLRDEMKKGSEIGREITPFMNAGTIPPVNITIKLVRHVFETQGSKGAVFDGYPRNMDQLKAMEEFAKPDIVINLIVPKEILIERMLARRTCPNCSSVYNLADIRKVIDGVSYSMPTLLPRKDGICDNCGAALVKRNDETPEIIATRLKVHDNNSKPLIEYYEKQGVLRNVYVTSGKEIMMKKIFELIDNEVNS